MHTTPRASYNGITIITDGPSRFDIDQNRLCAGPVTPYLESILAPRYSLYDCDLRDLTVTAPFIAGTKKIILSGRKAATKFGAFNDPPGYLTITPQAIPALPVFYLQDCCDHRSFSSDDENDASVSSDRDTKDVTPTLFSNHRFWTAWHIKKFLYPQAWDRRSYPPIDPIFYPNLETLVKVFSSITHEHLYLDIETSRLHRCLTCIGLSSDSLFPRIYVVPVYLYNGALAYKDFYRIYRAIASALVRNKVVIHNASYDIPVLTGWYRFPYPESIYDTMVAQHRCFPESEKSLGHTISTWTNFSYHKDTNIEPYNMPTQEQAWLYNSKDVYALKPIMESQLAYADTIPGLSNSIAQGCASVLPYIDTTLTGMELDLIALANAQRKLLRYKALYEKIARILTGIPTFNPGSTQQCSNFFHKKLNYPIVSRTATGASALGAKQLYQLLLKHNNPVINATIKYREVAKDASMLECELLKLP